MVAKRMGADVVPNFEKMDVIAEIKRLTDGKGVDVAIKELEGRILEATRRAPTGGATDWCTR
jgi:NADPH:quinone reductase-like Zn-dependent oxidoreductase